MVDTSQRAGSSRARPAGAVRLKRAYAAPEATDGYRVLVDRLWPRGVRKDALTIDAWMKEIGPSNELRRWFGHDPRRWEAFASCYRDELRRPPAAGLIDELVARTKRGAVTLVHGAKDEAHNQAVVIRGVIEQRLRRMRARARSEVRTTRAAGARSRPPVAPRGAPTPSGGSTPTTSGGSTPTMSGGRAHTRKKARAGGTSSPTR